MVHSRIRSTDTIGMDCITTCFAAAAVVPQLLLWHIAGHVTQLLGTVILNQHSAVLDITPLSISYILGGKYVYIYDIIS